MPLFEYLCRSCSKLFEAYKRPSEEASSENCPSCGGKAGKVEISLVGSAGGGGGAASKATQCGSGPRRSPFS